VGLGLLTAFSAAALAAGLGRAVVTTYVPVTLARIHDAPGLIGTVMLVNVVAGFAVPLVVGAWSDRLKARGHGRTRPFILGGSLVTAGGLAAVALGTGTTYAALALAAAVAYVGLNAVTTAHRALIAESFPDEARPRVTSAEELALLLGTVVGVGLGGALIDTATWAPFAVAAIVVPVLSAPTVARMRGRERLRAARPGHEPRTRYLAAALRPGVRSILAAQALWVMGYAALPAFFILYCENVLGLRAATAAALLIAFGAITALAMLAAGAARADAAHGPLLVLGVALLGGGLLAVAPAGSVLAAAPGLAAGAAGYGILSTIGFPALATLIPAGEAGAYTALYFAVRALSGAVALPAAGWTIAVADSYRALMLGGGLVALLALAPLAGMYREPLLALGSRLWRIRRPRPARLLVGAAALAGALGLTLAVGLAVDASPLGDLDRSLFSLLNTDAEGWSVVDRLVVSPDFRNYAIIVAATLAAAVAWRRDQAVRSVAFLVLSGLIAFALVRICWIAWDRPRPEEVVADAETGLHSWAPYASFPSGHVAVTTALCAAIAILFPRVRALVVAFALLVAVTRPVFGAHFPSDVLGAVVLGLASAVAAWWLLAELGLPVPTGSRVPVSGPAPTPRAASPAAAGTRWALRRRSPGSAPRPPGPRGEGSG
jgi:MFS family permease